MIFLLQYGLPIMFTIGMLVWFYRAKKQFCTDVSNDPYGEYSQPKTAQTLGVLCTFLGITIGLFSFNPEYLHESVMNLLGGMTTAFVTSILGMGMYLWLNMYQENKRKAVQQAYSDNINPDASIADLIYFLQSEANKNLENRQEMLAVLQDNNRVLGETISKAIQDVQKSVLGDGDYTVIGQMKQIRLEYRDEIQKLRQEYKEANGEMVKEFRDFAKTMAENNAKAFIEMLNQTISDFNDKLTEQFGENFKQLNIAVGALLTWQDNYKETIANVTITMEEIFKGIQNVRDSMAAMETSAGGMIECSNNMADIIVTAQSYNKQMEQTLNDLKKLGMDAKEAVPNIENLVQSSCNSIVDISDAIDILTKATVEKVETMYGDIAEEINSLTEILQESGEHIEENNKQAIEALSQQSRKSIQVMEEVADAMREASHKSQENFEIEAKVTQETIRNAAQRLEKEALTITKNISDDLEEMSKKNRAEMEEYLNNSLKSLGNMMGTISQKFADDYRPIADRLAEIVELARK